MMGGFIEHNTFTGFIADVHVHGQVLTTHQIKTYMEAKTKYKLGDYINWHNLMYTLQMPNLLTGNFTCTRLYYET